MSLLTLPPNIPSASRRYILRRQVSIFLRVPLGGNGRTAGLQTILFTWPPAGAIGAAVPADPLADGALPDMPLLTLPPNLLPASRRYITRGQLFISLRIPLGGEFRMGHRQAQVRVAVEVLAARNPFPFSLTSLDARLPHEFAAPPPVLFAGAIEHLIRRQGRIAFIVPLLCQLRIPCKQGIVPADSPVITIRAAFGRCCLIEMAGSTLPCMPLFTLPPKTFIGLIRYLTGYERQILCSVPDLNKCMIQRPHRAVSRHCPRMTDGASAFAGIGAGTDSCFPSMAFRTCPVYFFFRAGHYIIRC